jgi:hypothetical protein
MKKHFIILLSIVVGFTNLLQAQDTTKILFVGNSFTAANDLQAIVKKFYETDHSPCITMAYAPGGITVGDVSMGTAAHMYNPLVFDLIRNTEWDFMVLQDNQGRFALDSAVFPPTTASKVIEGHLKIRDSLHYYHPCAKMVWFSGWGLKGLDSGKYWIDSITVNYRVMNDLAKDVIAPIGPAWRNLVKNNPFISDLWDADGAHPSAKGSYLTAAVIYSTLSNKDVMANPFNYTIPPPEADFLKSVAQKTLSDPFIRQKSNVEGIASANLTWDIARDKLVGESGKIIYQWYMDNVLLSSSTDSLFSPKKTGRYRLWTKDALGNWQKSCALDISISTGLKNSANDESSLIISPNPTSKFINIKQIGARVKSIEVYSLIGKKELEFNKVGPEMNLDFSSMASGIYLVKCQDENNNLVHKIEKVVKQ